MKAAVLLALAATAAAYECERVVDYTRHPADRMLPYGVADLGGDPYFATSSDPPYLYLQPGQTLSLSFDEARAGVSVVRFIGGGSGTFGVTLSAGEDPVSPLYGPVQESGRAEFVFPATDVLSMQVTGAPDFAKFVAIELCGLHAAARAWMIQGDINTDVRHRAATSVLRSTTRRAAETVTVTSDTVTTRPVVVETVTRGFAQAFTVVGETAVELRHRPTHMGLTSVVHTRTVTETTTTTSVHYEQTNTITTPGVSTTTETVHTTLTVSGRI